MRDADKRYLRFARAIQVYDVVTIKNLIAEGVIPSSGYKNFMKGWSWGGVVEDYSGREIECPYYEVGGFQFIPANHHAHAIKAIFENMPFISKDDFKFISVEGDASYNQIDEDGITPLQIVYERGYNTRYSCGFYFHNQIFVSYSYDLEDFEETIVRISLCKMPINDDDKNKIPEIAITDSKIKIEELYQQKNAREQLLIDAINCADLAEIRYLVVEKKINVNFFNELKQNPLNHALDNYNLDSKEGREILNTLLDLKALPSMSLIFAVLADQNELILQLKKIGGHKYLQRYDFVNSLIGLAIAKKSSKSLKELSKLIVNFDKIHIPHIETLDLNLMTVRDLLTIGGIDEGGDVNMILGYIVYYGRCDLIKLLIDAGANVNSPSFGEDDKLMPIQWALKSYALEKDFENQKLTIQTLFSFGADSSVFKPDFFEGNYYYPNANRIDGFHIKPEIREFVLSLNNPELILKRDQDLSLIIKDSSHFTELKDSRQKLIDAINAADIIEIDKLINSEMLNINFFDEAQQNPLNVALENRLINFAKFDPIVKVLLSFNALANKSLHFAIIADEAELIDELIKLGADIKTTLNKKNLLHIASENNSVNSLKKLLELGLYVNSSLHFHRDFSRPYAYKNGIANFNYRLYDPEEFKINLSLDKYYVEPRLYHNNPILPLDIAAENGHAKIIRLLAAANAKRAQKHLYVYSSTYDNTTRVLIEEGFGEVKNIENLLEGKPQIEENFEGGDDYADAVHLFKICIEKGTNFNSLLCLAAYNGHYDLIKSLIQVGAEINSLSHKLTPIQIAFLSKKLHADFEKQKLTIQTLFTFGADIEVFNTEFFKENQWQITRNYEGFTVENDFAVASNITEFVLSLNNSEIISKRNQELTELKTQLNQLSIQKALIEAINSFKIDEVEKIVRDEKLNINFLNELKQNPLNAALENEKLSEEQRQILIKKLLFLGADINKSMEFAVLADKTKLVSVLIKIRTNAKLVNDLHLINSYHSYKNYIQANIEKLIEIALEKELKTSLIELIEIAKNEGVNKFGFLQIIIENNNLQTLILLLEAGLAPSYKIDNSSKSLLNFAIEKGHIEIIKTLAKYSARDIDNEESIFYAIESNNIEALKTLIDAKANANISQKIQGLTPLYRAVENDNLEIAKVLIDAKADVNIIYKNGKKNENQSTKNTPPPLHIAVNDNDIQAVASLIDISAEINIVDRENKGLTALHIAVANSNLQIVKMLIRAQGNPNIISEHGKGTTPLNLAIKENNQEIVEILLKAKADPNVYFTKDKPTALSIAIENDNLDIIKALIAANADLNHKNDKGQSFIYLLSKNGNQKIIEILAQSGADINQTDDNKQTPLSIACENGHLEVIDLLIEFGADINEVDVTGQNCIFKAVIKGDIALIQKLIEMGADLNFVSTAEGEFSDVTLIQAALMSNELSKDKEKQQQIIELLFQYGADIEKLNDNDLIASFSDDDAIEKRTHKIDELKQSLYELNQKKEGRSFGLEKIDKIDFLQVELPYFKPKIFRSSYAQQFFSFSTPLTIALEKNQQNMVELLIKNGAEKIPKDILFQHVSSGNIVKIREVLDLNFNSKKEGLEELKDRFIKIFLKTNQGDENTLNEDDENALQIAAKKGRNSIFKLILAKAKELNIELDEYINATNKYGYSCFHHAAENGHINIIKTLISHKINIKIDRGSSYYTQPNTIYIDSCLQLAAKNGHLKVIKFLFDHYKISKDCYSLLEIALANLINHDGYNLINYFLKNISYGYGHLLFLAAKNNDLNLINLITNRNYGIDDDAIFDAIQNSNIEIIERLLELNADVNTRLNYYDIKYTTTPLYQACRKGNTKIVELLISYNAIIDDGNENGVRPLHVACQYNNIGAVKLLIQSKANINIQDKAYKTPAYYAAEYNSDGCIEALAQAKADLDLADNFGQTPFKKALQNNKIDALEALLENCSIDIISQFSYLKKSISQLLKTPTILDRSLINAILFDKPELFMPLKKIGANIFKIYNGKNLIHIAAENNSFRSFLELINLGFDPLETDNCNLSPFLIACASGSHRVIESIATLFDIDVNEPNEFGKTPLYLACENSYDDDSNDLIPDYLKRQNYHDTIKYLIEFNADVNYLKQYKTLSNSTAPLNDNIIISQNIEDFVKLGLLPIDFEFDGNMFQDNSIEISALGALCCKNNVNLIELLISNRANINKTFQTGSFKGFTAIKLATWQSKMDAVEMLFKYGAKISTEFFKKETASHYYDRIPEGEAEPEYGSDGEMLYPPPADEPVDEHLENKKIVESLNNDESIQARNEKLEELNLAIDQNLSELSRIQDQRRLEKFQRKAQYAQMRKKLEEKASKEELELKASREELQDKANKEELKQKVDKDDIEKIINQNIQENKEKLEEFEKYINDQVEKIDYVSFGIDSKDIFEIKFIRSEPQLFEYYEKMKKYFNDAFLYANIVNQGGISIEETSNIAKAIGMVQNAVGEIPFAAIILGSIKYAASKTAEADNRVRQANFGKIIPESSLGKANFFAEMVARRFAITRFDFESKKLNIEDCKAGSESAIADVTDFLTKNGKGLGRRILNFFGKKADNIKNTWFEEEMEPNEKMVFLDFQKAANFIYKDEIAEEIKSLPDHDPNKLKQICDEIVKKSLPKMEIKFVSRELPLSTQIIENLNIKIKEQIDELTQIQEIENQKIAAENEKKLTDLTEQYKKQNHEIIEELKAQVAIKDEEIFRKIEENFRQQEIENQKIAAENEKKLADLKEQYEKQNHEIIEELKAQAAIKDEEIFRTIKENSRQQEIENQKIAAENEKKLADLKEQYEKQIEELKAQAAIMDKENQKKFKELGQSFQEYFAQETQKLQNELLKNQILKDEENSKIIQQVRQEAKIQNEENAKKHQKLEEDQILFEHDLKQEIKNINQGLKDEITDQTDEKIAKTHKKIDQEIKNLEEKNQQDVHNQNQEMLKLQQNIDDNVDNLKCEIRSANEELKDEIKLQQEIDRKYLVENGANIEKMLGEIKKIKNFQQKFKKLAEIADFAPDMEITISRGNVAQKTTLGNVMSEARGDRKIQNDFIDQVILQISSKLEDFDQRIDNIENVPRPSVRLVESSFCTPNSRMCIMM